jgi:hypothetical protein
MAGATPNNTELMVIINALQAQVTALQNATPAAAAAPPAGTAPVVFTDTRQTLGADDLIDYLTKEGQQFLSNGAKHLMTRHLPMALP